MEHKFEIGQKVIFIKKSNREYAWELEQYEQYKIEGRAKDVIANNIENIKQNYYSVIRNGVMTSWFIEEDFIDLKEYRKLKLKNLNNFHNEI